MTYISFATAHTSKRPNELLFRSSSLTSVRTPLPRVMRQLLSESAAPAPALTDG